MGTKKAGAGAPTKKEFNTKDIILSILKKNRAGISRGDLRELMHLDDRQIRNHIAELRDEGHMIGIGPDGGYTYGRKRDFDRVISFFEAKTRKEEQRLKKMKKTREMADQVLMRI